MEQRMCMKCGNDKPLKDFPITKKPNGNEYYQHTCKKCRSDQRVANRKNIDVRDHERKLAQTRYNNNKQLVLEKNKQWRDSEDGTKNRMIHRSLQRAREKGYEHSISIDDILIPNECPVLHIPFCSGTKSGGYWNTPSIDRKDSTKGYTKDNIQIISMRANTMKSDASVEELVKFARWVLDTYCDDIVQPARINEGAELPDKEPVG